MRHTQRAIAPEKDVRRLGTRLSSLLLLYPLATCLALDLQLLLERIFGDVCICAFKHEYPHTQLLGFPGDPVSRSCLVRKMQLTNLLDALRQ